MQAIEAVPVVFTGAVVQATVRESMPHIAVSALVQRSTYGTAGQGLLTAYKGSNSIGVSFGALQSSQTANSDPVTVNELQYKQRQLMGSNTWRSASLCTFSVFGNCTQITDQTGTLYQWQYKNASGTYVTGPTAVTKPTDVAPV